MKYKYIPTPELAEGEEKKPLHRIDGDTFIIGWEIGHWIGEDEEKEWEKLREVMELSPEDEAEWEYQQSHQAPTKLDTIEAQTLYTALMTDTLIEGE